MFVLIEATGTGGWPVPVGRELSLACVAVDWVLAAGSVRLQAVQTAASALG